MIRAEIELNGQLQVLKLDVKSKSEAIETIWNTYGYMTYIIDLESLEDTNDEQIDSRKSANAVKRK